jgi:lipopolysaccharide transport system ATP-binding protein
MNTTLQNKLESSVTSSADVLVKVDGVSKKFCKSLKRSLWYGVRDVAAELNPFARNRKAKESSEELREGEFWAVNDVSFELRRGECLGLIGHNGAGKTTLLKMLNGLIKPDRGHIEMKGRVGALIALGAGFNPILTGRENIYVNSSIYGLSKSEVDSKIDSIIEFADIREFIDAPLQSYSSGMQIRLGFAVATSLEPDVLILDEVLAVGDVAFQAKCFNRLAEYRQRGTAFILVSHNMHQISRYCQSIVYLNQGKVRYLGDVDGGISEFLVDMKQAGSDNYRGPDWSIINGSGKVVLTGARFLDRNGAPIDKLQAGGDLIFEVSYKSTSEQVVDPVFDVLIRCRGECVFQATNRSCRQPLGSLPKAGKLIVQFDKLPCNNGPLDFYFCLLDGKSHELFDWKRDLRLEVSTDAAQTGSLRLEPRWELISDSD